MNEIQNILEQIEQVDTWYHTTDREKTLDSLTRWVYPRYSTICCKINSIDNSDIDYIPSKLKEDLLDYFKSKNEFVDDWDFLMVVKYEVGEYIPPHRDEQFAWHRLLTLNDSDIDGVCMQNDETERIDFHPDKAGNILTVPVNAQHWVNPVRTKRHSVILAKIIKAY